MVYVFLANGFEEMEAVAPIDLLRRSGAEVATVGVGGKTIVGAHGISFLCDMAEEEADVQNAEMVVLPGGMPGTVHLEESRVVCQFIDHAQKNNLWIGAICAAPSILGHKGLLQGKRATCFPGFEQELLGAVVTGSYVEQDGHIITARGAGAATEFALALVAALQGNHNAAQLRGAIQCPE